MRTGGETNPAAPWWPGAFLRVSQGGEPGAEARGGDALRRETQRFFKRRRNILLAFLILIAGILVAAYGSANDEPGVLWVAMAVALAGLVWLVLAVVASRPGSAP